MASALPHTEICLNMNNHQALKSYPIGYSLIFFSEFISRFAFWGIQSLLVLYLVSHFSYNHAEAYGIFGVYASLSWAISILGGYIADRYLGFRRILLFGFTFALLGNIFLLTQEKTFLFLGLGFLVLGTGLIIPNNCNMLGTLYEPEDARRDKGFGTFYVAGNLGAMLAPILLGYLNEYLGWTWAFSVTGLAFVAWLGMYVYKRHYLSQKGNFDGDKPRISFVPFINIDALIFLLLAFLGLLTSCLLQDSRALGYTLALVSLIGLIYLVLSLMRHDLKERLNTLILLAMIFFVLIFFACEFQTLNSFIIFMREYVNMHWLGLTIPVTAFVSAESMFVVILTFLVANPLWSYLGDRQPKPFIKLAIGTLLAGISFLIFAYVANLAGLGLGKPSLWWMILGVAIISLGELFVMPPLLSAMTKLAPPKIKGTMVGIMYFAISISGFLSGEIAKLTASVSNSASAYESTYLKLALFMLLVGGATFFLCGVFKKRLRFS